MLTWPWLELGFSVTTLAPVDAVTAVVVPVTVSCPGVAVEILLRSGGGARLGSFSIADNDAIWAAADPWDGALLVWGLVKVIASREGLESDKVGAAVIFGV